ncbi:T9SS type A sorting domain-containing protein [Aequorivita sp. SDUM287046]|uniref:T9SS type A sorting domain-containing protein n=1 Tax=Aequorivita aurantiaca TaxID=3053356 RepID=A0ABT8DNG5_9FLAO|nr:T9SS type A sorting domain-containing protein [Aequorivita aurantiaca]MDN3725511.1 T9SS type A sorting domain-containing protein [Aequorivita aurantiaca]
MRKITLLKSICCLLFFISSFTICSQERIGVIQEGQVILLDRENGNIIDPAFISLNSGTPKALIQVDEEIWITYQLDDKIERYSLDGNFLSSIDTGLDNIRGLGIVNSEVWVCNAGTGNGAPGDGIVRFDFDGNNLGFFLTTPQSVSPFDVIDNGNGEAYISYSSTDNIERRDYSGSFLGNIVPSGVVSFVQQIAIEEPGVILAAVFSVISGGNQNGLYRFSETDGAIIDYWSLGNLRGVATLGNGEILWSSGSGVSRLNPTTGISELISAGNSQFFGSLNFTTVGINEFNENAFRFYPNPTQDLLYLSHSSEIAEVNVSNVLGQQLFTIYPQTKKVEVDLASFPAGIYFINLKSAGASKTLKVIKE